MLKIQDFAASDFDPKKHASVKGSKLSRIQHYWLPLHLS